MLNICSTQGGRVQLRCCSLWLQHPHRVNHVIPLVVSSSFYHCFFFFWRGRWHTLVSVSRVVPATTSDKLHVARKWRLLALIERLSLSAARRAHLYSVSATHDQRVQMKLSYSSATTDVVWTEHRKRKMSSLYKKSNKITMSLLFFSLTPLFFFPLSEISITLLLI